MIKRIKKLVSVLKEGNETIIQNQKDQLALTQLLGLFKINHFIPLTTWSASPQSIINILNIISLGERKSVIEFGSGATTLYIAQLIKTMSSDIKFISVESDITWFNKMKNFIKIYKIENYVQLILAPITDVDNALSYKGQTIWYDVTKLENHLTFKSIDLVIVDGPFGGSTPFARYSAFPVLKEYVAENAIWLLDDTNRSHEKEIIKEWSRQSKLEIKDFNRYSLLMPKSQFSFEPFNSK